MKKTVLITGASKGIGKITAIYFKERGWNVAATMRNPENEKELGKYEGIKLIRLDVTDAKSIETGINEAIKEFGNIDVLVNNAGYPAVGIFEKMTEETIRNQFNVNVFGLMAATKAVLPHFRKNINGTIINITSIGGKLSFPIYSMYHSTKWAVEGFSESLYYEMKEIGIKVKIIEPGIIKTDFYGSSMDYAKKDEFPEYDKFESYNKNIVKTGNTGDSPEAVAKVIYRAATDGKKKLRYTAAKNAWTILVLRKILPDVIFMKLIEMIVKK